MENKKIEIYFSADKYTAETLEKLICSTNLKILQNSGAKGMRINVVELPVENSNFEPNIPSKFR